MGKDLENQNIEKNALPTRHPIGNEHFDIGVVGWWYNANYGGALTYYALHQVLKSMGLSVLMIERPTENPNYVPDYGIIPRRFAKKYYAISKNYHPNLMGELNGCCDAFISGSDQLFSPWLWEYSGPSYYLDFGHPEKNLISYASSFGNSYGGTTEFTDKISYYLHRFSAISVREDYAVDIVKDNFGLTAKKVLDPIFVCDPKEYHKLADNSRIKTEGKYFASFFLDPCKEKKEAILYLKDKLNLPYVNLIHACDFEENAKKLGLDNIMFDLDIEDFLNFYRNAEFIITDSFHGTCLAIIFNKPFISIGNKERGIKRFYSMLNELGLMERLVNDYNEIYSRPELLSPVDYTEVKTKLETLKEDSYNWLKKAIFEPASKAAVPFNVFDIYQYDKNKRVNSQFDELRNFNNQTVQQNDKTVKKISELENENSQLKKYIENTRKTMEEKIQLTNREFNLKIAEVQEENKRLYEKIEEILEKNKRLNGKIEEITEENLRVISNNADLHRQIDDYENSSSWKITKPLREASKIIKKKNK